MALAPRFAGHRLVAAATPHVQAIHTVELYLDYVCPFSAKMFRTFYREVVPALAKKSYAHKVQFIFRQQVQPWHPSSTLVHEAGVAVLRLAPAKFFDFSDKLFDHQVDYFDVNVVNESRNESYKRLAKLGASVGVDEEQLYQLLQVPSKPDGDSYNVGNKVTDDFKVLVKMARLVGVHVSPTVIFNGVVENGISSSFSADQWLEWLSKNCSDSGPSL